MLKKASATIRKFRIEDIDKVLEIKEQAFPRTAYPKEALPSYAKRLLDHFIVIGATEDVAGYLFLIKRVIPILSRLNPIQEEGFWEVSFITIKTVYFKML